VTIFEFISCVRIPKSISILTINQDFVKRIIGFLIKYDGVITELAKPIRSNKSVARFWQGKVRVEIKKPRCFEYLGYILVEISRIELLTSCMPCKRSPS